MDATDRRAPEAARPDTPIQGRSPLVASPARQRRPCGRQSLATMDFRTEWAAMSRIRVIKCNNALKYEFWEV